MDNRLEYITNEITMKKFLKVEELSQELNVSGETIRRDLKTLEKQGVLSRTHGGAYLIGSRENDVSVHVRKSIMIENKKIIAEQCASLIDSGDTVFLDSSTTALEIAKQIAQMPVTVITNSALIIEYLLEIKNIRLVALGGILDTTNMCFFGNLTLQSMQGIYARKAFISCRTLSESYGVMDSNEQSSQVRKVAVKNSERCYLVADHTKFGGASLNKIGDFEDFDMVIADKQLSEEWLSILNDKGLEVRYPGGVSYPKAKEERENEVTSD